MLDIQPKIKKARKARQPRAESEAPEPAEPEELQDEALVDGEPHRGFTEAEKQNIIELYKRGDKPTRIAKMFGKKPGQISQLLWQMKNKGQIT